MDETKEEVRPRTPSLSLGAMVAADLRSVLRPLRRNLGFVTIAVMACVTVAVVGQARRSADIEVVESGFSVLEDSESIYDLSYGVVVENTTDKVAYHTVICIRLRPEETTDGCRRYTIDVIEPGQRVGFGGLEFVDNAGDVTGVSVEVRGTASWEDSTALVSDDPPAATNVELSFSPEQHPAVAYDHRITVADLDRDPVGYAVLRDREGEIVGAAGGEVELPPTPDQITRQSIVFEAAIPDVATAEVYVIPSGL